MNSPIVSGKISADLQAALALVRTGRHAAARDLLRRALALEPELVDAHWLLAGSLFETGDFGSAREELHTVIRLDPKRAPAYAMLGQILASSGQLDAAAQMFRRSLELQRHPATAAKLGRTLLMQGKADQAMSVLAPFAKAGSATRELLLLYGHALMMLAQPAESAIIFERLVQMSPQDGEAKLRLAAALSDTGRHSEAEASARKAMSQGIETPEAHFVLGRALMGRGNADEAELELRRAVRGRPDHIVAQANLSELVWMRSGDVQEACKEIDSALRKRPGLSQLRITKAKLFLAAGQSEPALKEIETGMALAPMDVDLHIAAAQIGLDVDATRALSHARQALQIGPDNPRALSVLGDAVLANGDAVQAADIANRLLAANPLDGRAIALLATAWRMSEDVRYRTLFDYENLVRTQVIDVPDGWPTLASYLEDLAVALHRMHSFATHPVNQSLRRGSQVELDLERSPEPAIRAFARAVDGPIRRYMDFVGTGKDPLRRRNTGRYQIKGAWSVRLRSAGFHVNHFHPQGWLSSACYIQLPPAVGLNGREGWLQLGEPGFPTRPGLPPEHFIKPEPGLLALFPSYMWHGTVPFSGDAAVSRLTVAFDVVPA